MLIVEDEQALANGLKFNFEQEGFEVVHCVDGPSALELFHSDPNRFDIVILDLMLPSMSGYDTCKELRKINNDVPVLVLSARTLSEDRALAFDCGTDQYMTKPFALPELLSRVRNLLARRGAGRGDRTGNQRRANGIRKFGNVTVDFGTFQISMGETVHDLTTMELDLLKYFIDHEGIVLSRNEILDDVWGEDSNVTTRTIDNFVMRLRRIIEENPSEPRHIVSVRGTGYRFLSRPEAS